MKVTVVDSEVSGIPAVEMEDGQIGIVVAWVYRRYLGLVVQRYGESLAVLGASVGDSWPGFFADTIRTDEDNNRCRVHILPSGTLFKLSEE